MKTTVSLLLGMVAMVGLLVAVQAKEEKKAETLKGTICCTKCCLKETDECGNAIKVKVDDKDVIYYFKDEGKKESYHKAFCTKGSTIKGSVTGVVTEKDGKKWITPSKDGVKIDD
jgi:hypothetical protein